MVGDHRMIGALIDQLSAVSPAVGQRFGLCEKRDDRIYQYTGGGSGVEVNVDTNGTWSYFRLTGPIRKGRGDVYKGCEGWRHTVPIRFVLVTRRDADICDVASRIVKAEGDFQTAKSAIGTATGAMNVLMNASNIETDTARALKSEMPNATGLLEVVFQYADVTIDLLTERDCIIYC